MAPKKKRNTTNGSDEDDELDSLCHRLPSAPQTRRPTTKPIGSGSGSGSGSPLAPSKSTLYVSNLDYSLTNSDLHTLFSRFGKIARVTVLKDRHTRRSCGVAFVQFVTRDDATAAAREMHDKVLNGRKLSASIAEDNGRAAEFIKKREYKDKSRCYECGAEGHLSYDCPKNQLGPRERPPQKKPRRFGGRGGGGEARGVARGVDEGGWESGGERFEDDNWASVVDGGANQRLLLSEEMEEEEKKKRKKKVKKGGYFSDESDHDDEN